jgi:class 3 adenylate cyclase
MARITLKNIIGKKNDTTSPVLSLIQQISKDVWIEDDSSKILFGTPLREKQFEYPVKLDDEMLGWVKGNEKAQFVADLLTFLSQKEAEKKKLGSEVLNLYQEVNLIFNFSEKLAQTIEPAAIAQTTLTEASHVIKSDRGVVVMWDEKSNSLHPIASTGELFFSEEKVNSNLSLLLKVILSGQSEIIGDMSSLAETGILSPQIKTILYAALKVNHRVMGAIILARHESTQYTAADLKLLTTLALQSSSAIESALLYEKNIRESKEREEAMRRVYEITGKFVPYEFIGSLGHALITDVKLGDQVEKIVTVLFSDIRDYTALSEQMTPEENFSFVCSFNERMGPIIRKHRGFINQYLGDAIMAIFTGNASDALAAAIEMQVAVRDFNLQRKSINQSAIRIGVGMHTGPLIMGITGDQNRLDATTISDTVNTASRIESLTKYYKADIIISDACLQQIINPKIFHLRNLGLVQLKGKQEALRIHECFSGNSENELQGKIDSLSIFNEGIIQYLNRSFENAGSAFQSVIESYPDDRTARFFYNKTRQLIDTGIPENWVGVVEMQDK